MFAVVLTWAWPSSCCVAWMSPGARTQSPTCSGRRASSCRTPSTITEAGGLPLTPRARGHRPRFVSTGDSRGGHSRRGGRSVSHAELLVDMLEVLGHGCRSDPEVECDLLI